MRTVAFLFAFVALPFLVSADPQADYWKLLNSRDYPNALTALQAWDKAEPDSPEVLVGYIN